MSSPKISGLTPAKIVSHSPKFSFARPLDGGEDIYISASDRKRALPGDLVMLHKLGTSYKGIDGVVERVVVKGSRLITGTLSRTRMACEIIPDHHFRSPIPVEKGGTLGARNGDKVQVLLSFRPRTTRLSARVVKIYGKASSARICADAIIDAYGIPTEFPAEAAMEAKRLAGRGISSKERENRLDLRESCIFTIDGADAKDLDDAISVTKKENGWELGVHIADVSNYVQGGSALDREALKRGTSVYLVDRVIPMLPTRLSNGICSLNQGEDRLALSCLMTIDGQGRVINHQIAETVIRVNRRMTYTAVKKILEGDQETASAYQELVPLFYEMRDLSALLRRNRTRRGSIDFDFPESKVLLDEQGHPVEIRAYEANVATRIIEDFMLLANETVAREYCERQIPFLYRTHENPDSDKMENVLTFIRGQGIPVNKHQQEITPAQVQEILTAVEGKPSEPLISRLLLRSMKQARYTTGCSGHFGLAARHYCHFTSPIRRYPDLQIHRIIKDTIRGRMNQEKKEHYAHILEDVATWTSQTERRAEEVERETVKMKKAEYMAGLVRQTFEGVISGVTGWGLYVELPNTVEGLVHVNSMKDYYRFDEENYQLVGEHNGVVFHLGDPVRVQVAGADVQTRSVDFILEER